MKQPKQIIETEHNIFKNSHWLQSNQVAIYKHDHGLMVTVILVHVVVRVTLEPVTTGLRVQWADHSFTLPAYKCQVPFVLLPPFWSLLLRRMQTLLDDPPLNLCNNVGKSGIFFPTLFRTLPLLQDLYRRILSNSGSRKLRSNTIFFSLPSFCWNSLPSGIRASSNFSEFKDHCLPSVINYQSLLTYIYI